MLETDKQVVKSADNTGFTGNQRPKVEALPGWELALRRRKARGSRRLAELTALVEVCGRSLSPVGGDSETGVWRVRSLQRQTSNLRPPGHVTSAAFGRSQIR